MQENIIHEDEIDLRELLKTLWNKRKFICIFTFIITLLAIVFVLIKTPIYEAQAIIQIGSIEEKPLENSSILEKKLNIVFNIGRPDNNISLDHPIVSKAISIKKLRDIVSITTQGYDNKWATKKINEVLNFITKEYQQKIDEYIFDINSQIKNKQHQLVKINEIEVVDLDNEIKKLKTQKLPLLEKKIDFLKNTTLKLIENKLAFNQQKIEEYEQNIKQIGKKRAINGTQALINSTQILSNQNLILSLQNRIEDLKKEKQNIIEIKLKELIDQKTNLTEDRLRQLLATKNIIIKEKIQNLQDDIRKLEYKKSQNNIKQSQIVGKIITNDFPAKPKKKLIVVVAFVTAFMLSIFLVFFMEFLKGFKEEEIQTT